MRIAVCVKRDIHGLVVLRKLLPVLIGHDVRVFCSDKERPQESLSPALRQIGQFERERPFQALARLGEREASWDKCHPSTWTTLRNLSADEDADVLMGYRPDLIISARFSLIFPEWFISRVPGGIINIHPAPLPAYRGLFTPFWQILNNEHQLACTVHLVNKGIDTGPIIGMTRLDVDRGRCLLWNVSQIYCAGVSIVETCVRSLERGAVMACHEQSGQSFYYGFPSEAECQLFEERCGALVTERDYHHMLLQAGISGGGLTVKSEPEMTRPELLPQ